jgi:hypothetical protein
MCVCTADMGQCDIFARLIGREGPGLVVPSSLPKSHLTRAALCPHSDLLHDVETKTMTKRHLWTGLCVACALTIVPQISQAQARPNARTPPASPPIALRWDSKSPCNFGPQLAPYVSRAIANMEANQRAARVADDENITGLARVNRQWGRLRISAVTIGYESIFIHFDKGLPDLLAQTRSIGIRPLRTEGDGTILIYEEGTSSGLSAASDARERALGRSVWWCGS